MADVNANIGINFDSSAALAQLRRLQAGLSQFHQTLAEGNLAAANAQKGLNAQLIQSVNASGKFVASQAKVATSTTAFTNALEKNKLSLKEYFRYSAAAATANTKSLTKMFAQEREIINRARKDRVKALQSQYIQLNKANSGFVEAIRVMPRTLMTANGQFTELGTRIQYAAQRQQLLNQLLKQGSTQLLNFGKNTQWAGRQLMVGMTIPLTMLGGYAAKSFKEMEQAMLKFRRVYGDAFTDEAQTDIAVENIRRIAQEYTKFGVAVTETVDMAATAAAAGFAGGALEAQVREATKLAVLGQIEQQQALETTISLQNAFGISTDQLANKINFLNAVENQTVLSIEDLTIAIPKAAPIVKQLGGNVEDLAFFLTAMKEGGINASEGANALKSGLASLINPTEKASAMLAEMGVNIKGIVEANQGDLKGTVVGFARALDTLDPLNRARAIEQLFGKFQFSRLSTLFQNVASDGSQAARALDLAGASVEELAVLSEREMNKIEDSVGVKFQAALETLKQEIMPLGKAFLEALTPVVKFFGGLLEKFNGLSDGTKKAITIITGVVAGLGPILLMTFGLLANGLANLIKLFAMIRGGISKLNGQTKVLGAGFDYVTQSELENVAQSNALHTSHQRLIEVFNVEKTAAIQLANAYGALSSQMRSLASANPSLFMSPGAGKAVSKLPPVKGYKDGVVSVPGPKGAGDVVPAMVSPGETIIPADKSQKYSGFINAIMSDKVPGFKDGLNPFSNLKTSSSSQIQSFIDWADSEVKNSALSQADKDRWEKSGKKAFEKTFRNKVAYDPTTNLYWTDKNGTRGSQLEKLKQDFKYRAGIAPNESGQFVSSNKMNWGKFIGNITVGGTSKRPGDFRTNNPKAYREYQSAIAEASKPGNDLFGEKVNQKYRDFLVSRGITDERTIQKYLQLNASHLQPTLMYDNVDDLIKDTTRTQARRATPKEKYTVGGYVGPEYWAVNDYIKTKAGGGASRFEKILDWNQVNGNPLNLSKFQIQDLRDANTRIMKEGFQPFTKEDAVKLQRLNELELAARKLEAGGADLRLKGAPILKSGTGVRAELVGQILKDRLGANSNWFSRFNEMKMLVDLETGKRTGIPTVKTNEYYRDPSTGKFIKYTGQNTVALPPGSVSGSGAETRTPDTRKTGTTLTATRTQARNIQAMGGSGGKFGWANPRMRGFRNIKGDPMFQAMDPRLSKNAQGRISNELKKQAKLLSDKNKFTKQEIDNALRLYRRKLVDQEIQKANNLRQQQLDRQAEKVKQQNLVDERQKAKDDKRNRLMARQERVGRFSGGGSAAVGAVAMGAMMTGASGGVTGGLFGLSAVLGMLPMLMNPIAAVVTGFVALAGGVLLLNKRMDENTKKQVEYANATSMSMSKLQQVGELTGRVGLAERRGKAREMGLTTETNKFRTNFERGGTQFGQTFLESDVGKNILSGFKENMIKDGEEASKKIALQLAAFISDGLISVDQAESIARAIGIDLKDMTIASDINGNLRSLIGPDGTDILKDPLKVRINIVKGQQQTVDDLIQGVKNYDVESNSDALIQASIINARNLDTIRAQRDAQWQTNQATIDELEKKKQLAKTDAERKKIEDQIAVAKRKQLSDDKGFAKNAEDVLNKSTEIYDLLRKTDGAIGSNKLIKGMTASLNKQFKDDPFLSTLLGKAKALKTTQLEFKILTAVEGGMLTPSAATKLLTMFEGNDAALDAVISTDIASKDPDALSEFLSLSSKLDKKKGQKLFIDVVSKDPKKFNDRVAAMKALFDMDGEEIDVVTFLETGDAKEQLDKLIEDLNVIENEKKPITIKVLQEYTADPNMPDMTGLIANWEKYSKLPEESKKTVVQEYIMIQRSVSPGEISDFRTKNKIPSFMSNEYVAGQIAGTKLPFKGGSDINVKGADSTADDIQKGAGTKQNPVQDLLTRLKNVRLASINATGSINDLFKAVGKGKGAIKNAFSGIEQQLMNSGKNQQFISWITGLDKATQAKFGKTNKEGKFVLTDAGKAMEKGFDKAIVGEFNIAQKQTLKNLDNQIVATTKLKALGLSNSQIQEVLADQAYTTAIATGKVTQKELETNAALVKQQELRNKINSLVSRGAEQAQRNANQLRKEEVKTFLKEQGLSESEISIGLEEENLGAVIAAMDRFKNGAKGAKKELEGIKDALRAIAEGKELESVTESLTERVQKGYDAAMRMFEAYRKIIENTVVEESSGKTFTQLSKELAKSNAIMSELNAEIAIYENEISNIQAKIDKIKTDLENMEVSALIGADIVIDGEKITGRVKYVLEDLQEKINDWEREIELNYARPIKELQDESAALSNDLSLMDKEAEKINERYDKQAEALEEISKINEEILRQQQSQLDIADALTQGDISAAARAVQDSRAGSAQAFGVTSSDALQKSRENELANIRSANGLKREEIEKRIFDINQKIYLLETDPARKQMEDNILLAKDAIYNIEEAREQKLIAVKPLEEEILKIETDKLTSLKSQLLQEVAKNLTLDLQLTKLGTILEALEANHKVAGLTREEWDAMLVDAFLMDKILQEDIQKAIAGVKAATDELGGSWAAIKKAYDAITDKSVTISVDYVVRTPPPAGSGLPNTGANATGKNDGTAKTEEEKKAAEEAAKAAAELAKAQIEANEAFAAAVDAASYEANEARDKIARGELVNDYEYAIANDPNNGVTAITAEEEAAAVQAAQDFAAAIMAQIAAEAEAAAKAAEEAANSSAGSILGGLMGYENSGGMIKKKYMYAGGSIKHMYAGGMSLGADIVPAMLTPGEFVMSKYAVSTHGLDTMKSLNNGESVGDSVYNYSINVNVKSDADANEIASAVMNQIKRIDGQRVRGTRI